ncbi:MAG TPA: Uma2 family endonuclease [Castellaniella sp.]|nr:Uma2 family endonuclease [Castellaniella sp.]
MMGGSALSVLLNPLPRMLPHPEDPESPMAHAQTHEPETPMTREEFHAWLHQQSAGRFERIDGIVVAMAPERLSHNRRKRCSAEALRRAVRAGGLATCEVFADGITVPVDDSDFEPDAVLHCGPRLPGDATTVPDPLVLVEVLSPDSGTRDRVTKLRAYFRLPSVRHYLIVWPDEPRIVHHARKPDGQVATQILSSGEITLDPPGIKVTVEEFYAD